MAKQIAKLLRTETMADIDLKGLAQILKSKGRGKDTLLAHITPKEAEYLKRRGGSGTINPYTGLLEFDDEGVGLGGEAPAGPPAETSPVAPQPQITGVDLPPITAQTPTNYQPFESGFPEPAAVTPSYTPTTNYSLTGGAQPAFSATSPVFSPYSLTGGANYNITPPSLTTPPTAQLGDQSQYQLPGAGAQAPTQPSDTTFGMSNSTLARLGLAGGLGLLGAYKSKQAQKSADTGIAQQQAIAQPYQTTGANLQRAAAAGELTPQSMQSYQAAQAQLQQQVANTGGVGAAQATATLENLRQTLLNNQYNYGLQVSQIGDNIALGAIQQGMQLDQALNQASTNFYTQLAGIAAGVPTYANPYQRTV
jgi:hypothetical protein